VSARDATSGPRSPVLLAQHHDLGMILAQGQTVRHDFTLDNSTDRTIRLVRGTSLTPCCSTIGPLPKAVPPRGQVKIPVTFLPGYQSGLKGARFAVDTDDTSNPQRTLALTALLLSAWEIETSENSSTSLPLGHSGKQLFRLTARGLKAQGRGLPDEISAAPPLLAAFNGVASTTTAADGLVEATRHIVVTLPSSNEPGIRRGEVAFRWSAGRIETLPISWEVRPGLRVTPTGLVLRRSQEPVEQTVLVQSDGHPFRIIAVTSQLLADRANLAVQPGVRHRVSIMVDASKNVPNNPSDIVILTDHPFQPAVSVSVLVLPGSTGQGR
jgi:hypothetical protein